MLRTEFWVRPCPEFKRSKRKLLSQTDGELWFRRVRPKPRVGVGVASGMTGVRGFWVIFIGDGWLQATSKTTPGRSRVRDHQRAKLRKQAIIPSETTFYFTTVLTGWRFEASKVVWEGLFPTCTLPFHHEEK
jgi:hypothetical protein